MLFESFSWQKCSCEHWTQMHNGRVHNVQWHVTCECDRIMLHRNKFIVSFRISYTARFALAQWRLTIKKYLYSFGTTNCTGDQHHPVICNSRKKQSHMRREEEGKGGGGKRGEEGKGGRRREGQKFRGKRQRKMGLEISNRLARVNRLQPL